MPPIIELADGALITEDFLRAFLNVDEKETAVDAHRMTINAVSEEIESLAGREFKALSDDPETRGWHYDGSGYLRLSPSSLRAGEDFEVTINGNTVLASPRPFRPKGGAWGLLKLPRTPGVVEVTGVWGFPRVPDSIQYDTAVACAIRLQRDIDTHAKTFNVEDGQTMRPEGLPSSVRANIMRWRVPKVN